MALSEIVTAAPPHHVVLGTIGVLSLLVVLRSLFRATLTPLRSLPGPFLARFSRLWYLGRVWRGDFHKENVALHRQYGK